MLCLIRLEMVHELLSMIDIGKNGFNDLCVNMMIYLDKKGELTIEDIDHVFSFSLSSHALSFYKVDYNPTVRIIELANVIKKYSESVYDNFILSYVRYMFKGRYFNIVGKIIDLVKLDMPLNIGWCFDKWSMRIVDTDSVKVKQDTYPDRYVHFNFAQEVLLGGCNGLYKMVKTRYVYTKDDIMYLMNFLRNSTDGNDIIYAQNFIADQCITGDEMICYSNTGQKITVYEKIVEIIGTNGAHIHFGYLAPRPTYPIVKMIPDIGRVTLLDKTHATVQNLTATGLVEKQMVYEIIGDTIKLSPEKSLTAKW